MPLKNNKKTIQIKDIDERLVYDEKAHLYCICGGKSGKEWFMDFIDEGYDVDSMLSGILLYKASHDFYLDDSDKALIYAKKKAKEDKTGICSAFEYLTSKIDHYYDLIFTFVMYAGCLNDKPRTCDEYYFTETADIVDMLLNVDDSSDTVHEFSCVDRGFLCNLMGLSKEDHNMTDFDMLTGTYLNKNKYYTTLLCLAILSNGKKEYHLSIGNGLETSEYSYNKGFCYPPIDQHLSQKNKKYTSLLYPEIHFENAFDEQWIYVDRMLFGLKGDNVRGVALLYGKSLMQTKDNKFLQRLIDDGWVEGIYEFADDALVSDLGTIPYFVVFSKNNKSIDIFSSPDFYEDVISYPAKGSAKCPLIGYGSSTITINEAIKLNSLIPSRIPTSNRIKSSENCILLKDVSEIIIGTQYTASDFEPSTELTGYKILTPKDIEDWQVDTENLPSIVVNKTLFDKYAVKKDDLVLANKTTKIKDAVVTSEPSEKVIATGSMIIIRPNTDKLDPIYLKMFFDSDDGQVLLKTSQTGNSNYSFTATLLENLEIPLIDIDKQHKKANTYTDKMSSISAYSQMIKQLNDEVKVIIEDDEDL